MVNMQRYSGISIKRTSLVQKRCPLYRNVRFIETFSKIAWPQSKAIRFSPYCPSYTGVRFIVCTLYRDSTVYFCSNIATLAKWNLQNILKAPHFRKNLSTFVTDHKSEWPFIHLIVGPWPRNWSFCYKTSSYQYLVKVILPPTLFRRASSANIFVLKEVSN